MPNGCCPPGSIIILLLSGKGQLAPKAGGLRFPAVVSCFPSSPAGTEISKVLLCSLSLCLSLSPGMCAFAAFPFISLQQSEGKQRKGSKGDKSSRRRGKLTEVRAAASAARQSQGDASLAGAPLLLQSMVASLRCSRNCVDPTLRMPALRSPPTTTLYMWTALNLTLQKHSL